MKQRKSFMLVTIGYVNTYPQYINLSCESVIQSLNNHTQMATMVIDYNLKKYCLICSP